MPKAQKVKKVYVMFARAKIAPPDPHEVFGPNPVVTERGLDDIGTVGVGDRLEIRNLHWAISLDLLGLADWPFDEVPADALPLYGEVEAALRQAYGPSLIRLRRTGELVTVNTEEEVITHASESA